MRILERLGTAHHAAAQQHGPSLVAHQLPLSACSSTSHARPSAQFMNSPQTLDILSPLFPANISPSQPECPSEGQDLGHSQEGLRSQNLEQMPSLLELRDIHSFLPAGVSPPDSFSPAPSADWGADAWGSSSMLAQFASPRSSSRQGLAARQLPNEMINQQLNGTLPMRTSWAAVQQSAAPSMPNAQLLNHDDRACGASPVITLSELAGMLQDQEGASLSASPTHWGSASVESQALSEADHTPFPTACSPVPHHSIAESHPQHAIATLRHVTQTPKPGLSASEGGDGASGPWAEHTGVTLAHWMGNADHPRQPEVPQWPGMPADTGVGGDISAGMPLCNRSLPLGTRQDRHEAKSQGLNGSPLGSAQRGRNSITNAPASTAKAGSNSAEGPNDRPDTDHGGPAAYAAAVNSRIISSPEPGSVATYQELRPSVVCPKEQCLLSLLHSLATPASAHSSGPLLHKGFTLRSINSLRGDVGRTPKYCAMYQQHIQVCPVCLMLQLACSRILWASAQAFIRG